MNVIITNELQPIIAGLNIDIIKSVAGCYEADEIVEMFKNFYFGKMILDATAVKNYKNPETFQKISLSIPVEKVIILFPSTDPETGSNTYLSQLISMGFYNFTTDLTGLEYLYNNPNNYRDIAHIHQLGQQQVITQVIPGTNTVETRVIEKINYVSKSSVVLGVVNVTDGAGATSLVVMMKKLLEEEGLNVCAIEIDKRDFQYFNDNTLISTTVDMFPTELMKNKEKDVILVDINESNQEGTCSEVIYLLEASMIKLNRLLRRDRKIFEKLKGKKIIVNKSLLTNTDIEDLEYEAQTKIFYNLKPLNDRGRNPALIDFLAKLGLISSNSGEKPGNLFDLFRK